MKRRLISVRAGNKLRMLYMNFSRRDCIYMREGDHTFAQDVEADATPANASDAGAPIATQTSSVKVPKLKIIFVTGEDPIYVIEFFRVFLAEYPRAELEICGMMIDQAFHENIM